MLLVLYKAQLQVQPCPPLEHSCSVLQEIRPRRFHLSDAGGLLITANFSAPATIKHPSKAKFHFGSSGVLLITADSSADQNHRTLIQNSKWPWKSSNFLLKCHKPRSILRTALNVIIFQVPTEHSKDLSTPSGYSSPQSSRVLSQTSPKHGQVCHHVSNTPLCLYQIIVLP